MSKIFSLLFIIALAIAFIYAPLENTQITIKNNVLEIELAKTTLQKQKGLSGRKELEDNHGMLFIYEEPEIPSFWMKDMNFPIDIIWIDQNNKIIGIEKNINPNTYPQTFTPPEPILNVLEVNAGWSDDNNIEIGEEVLIN